MFNQPLGDHHGHDLIGVVNALAVLKAQSEREGAGVHYVAMRRVVENIGVAWQSQHPKVLEQKEKIELS